MIRGERPYLARFAGTAIRNEQDVDIVGQQTERIPQRDKHDMEAQIRQNDRLDDFPFLCAVHACSLKLILRNSFNRAGKNDRAISDAGQQLGPNSPLFGKDKMATFERYFVADKATHVENKNPYYDFQNDEQTALRILGEFGLSDSGFIINGHVPVKLGQGESPIRAGGRLLVIDGGLSRAYQPVTGIAGYTLIFTSHELNLVAHQPFESTAAAISAEQDIHSVQSLVKQMPRRLLIDDTDEGENLRCRIDDLMRLITAYRKGVIKEARS